MQIDNETVNKLATLARLEFDEPGREAIREDLQRILGFIDKLNELDTTEVEPLIFMHEEKNVLRNDESALTITQQEALKNAPDKDSDYFRVPKVLSK